jgi:hypothetical protein
MMHVAKETGILHRSIPGCVAILIHLTLPAKILGDYLIYRTGCVGMFPMITVPDRLASVAWSARLIGSLLVLPAIWLAAAYSLTRWHVIPLASVFLAGFLTLLLYSTIRRFSRVWRDVDLYHVGSAKELAGRGAIFQVFLGEDWQPQDRKRCMRAVRQACDWLEEKAREHGVSLDLVTGPKDLLWLDDWVMRACVLTRPNRWRAYRYEEDRLVQRLETLRPHLEEIVSERVKALPVKPDHVCLITHVPGPDIGLALPARNDLHLVSELEICCCGRGSTASIYAHELLHLFGASDLYFDPWSVLTRAGEMDPARMRREQQLAWSGFEAFRGYFSNSIMCGPLSSLNRLTVDPITARAVGWRKPDRQFIQTVQQIEQAIGKIVVEVCENTE